MKSSKPMENIIEVDNPANLPDMSVVEEIPEPIVKCFLMVPNENIGDMMQLVLDKRGTVEHTDRSTHAAS